MLRPLVAGLQNRERIALRVEQREVEVELALVDERGERAARAPEHQQVAGRAIDHHVFGRVRGRRVQHRLPYRRPVAAVLRHHRARIAVRLDVGGAHDPALVPDGDDVAVAVEGHAEQLIVRGGPRLDIARPRDRTARAAGPRTAAGPCAAVHCAATPDAATAIAPLDCCPAANAAGSRIEPDRAPGSVPFGGVS